MGITATLEHVAWPSKHSRLSAAITCPHAHHRNVRDGMEFERESDRERESERAREIEISRRVMFIWRTQKAR